MTATKNLYNADCCLQSMGFSNNRGRHEATGIEEKEPQRTAESVETFTEHSKFKKYMKVIKT